MLLTQCTRRDQAGLVCCFAPETALATSWHSRVGLEVLK